MSERLEMESFYGRQPARVSRSSCPLTGELRPRMGELDGRPTLIFG